MRVISIKPPKTVEKKATCKGCGTTVAYVPNDVKEYHGRDYSGGADGCTYLTCPTCRKQITLTSW